MFNASDRASLRHAPRKMIGHIIRSLDRDILAGTAAIFALFLVLEPALDRAASLPLVIYDASSIFGAALMASPAFALGVVLSVVAFLRTPSRTWWRLPREARWLWLPALAALLAVGWHLSTVDYNWALGRFYALDRLLLIALALASAVHPAFLAAFVVGAHAFAGQLEVPPMHFSWTDTNVLFHAMLVIFLWTALYDVRVRGRALRLPVASAWAVMLGLLGAWYFLPAVGKLRMGWLWETNLAFIFRAAYEQHGWWRVLDPETHAAIARIMERYALLMQCMGLLAETSVLFFFTSRWMTVSVLGLCLSMHVMIFATTGVLFWKWAFLLVALALVFVAMGRKEWRQTFPRWTMMLASLTVLLIYTFFGPRVTILAWYDAPFVYRYRVEALGESGRRYEVAPTAFAPWDSRFAQSRFYFLTDTKRIADSFGSVNSRTAYRRLQQAKTPAEVLRVIDEEGVQRTSSERRAELEAFFGRFLAATHEQIQDPAYDFGWAKAPQHIWTYQRADATLPPYRFQEPLERLEMELVQRHYFNGAYQVVSREDVLNAHYDAEQPHSTRR